MEHRRGSRNHLIPRQRLDIPFGKPARLKSHVTILRSPGIRQVNVRNSEKHTLDGILISMDLKYPLI
jgi:hypothetical protein